MFRLLRDIDLAHLDQAHVDLVKRLIRGKSFRRNLIHHCYPIAIDGSQELAGETLWAEDEYLCVGICMPDPDSGYCLGCGRPAPAVSVLTQGIVAEEECRARTPPEPPDPDSPDPA